MERMSVIQGDRVWRWRATSWAADRAKRTARVAIAFAPFKWPTEGLTQQEPETEAAKWNQDVPDLIFQTRRLPSCPSFLFIFFLRNDARLHFRCP